MGDVVFQMDIGDRLKTERTVEALKMRLGVESYRLMWPLPRDMRKRALDHLLAQTFAAESLGRQHPTDAEATGPAGFVARARELAAKYGDRFEPPASLVEQAERGGMYSDDTLVATG